MVVSFIDLHVCHTFNRCMVSGIDLPSVKIESPEADDRGDGAAHNSQFDGLQRGVALSVVW